MTIPLEELRRVADMAPSILNTKPWSVFAVGDDRVELRADWGQRLETIDPRHRELVISCGAALFNIRMAIRVTGHDVACSLVPGMQREADGCPHCGAPGLLASVEVAWRQLHGATDEEQRLYHAIPLRHTVREPFSQGIRPAMAVELEQAARMEGVYAVLLHNQSAKRVLAVAAAADLELTADQAHRAELWEWTGPGARVTQNHGVPAGRLAPEPADQRRPPVRDLGLTWDGTRELKQFEKHPQLIVLMTRTDTPPDWMRAGQALQRLLLTAACHGMQASFLTQQFEVNDWKSNCPHQWWPSSKPVQIVIRLGYTSSKIPPAHGALPPNPGGFGPDPL
jgi:nitroreductase